MKREEAIKLIDTHTVCFYNEIDSPTLQALHLAIEALSEPKSYNIKCEKGSTVTFDMSKKQKAEREQPDYCIAYRNGVCCYPIEACCDCPKHEYYRNLDRGKR